MQSTSLTTWKLPDKRPNLTQNKPQSEKEGKTKRKVSVSTNWLQVINKNQEKGVKSDKILKNKKLKGGKIDEIGTKSTTRFFTNIPHFRQTCCNQILAGDDENCKCGVGREVVPSKTETNAIYQTAHVLGGTGGGVRQDETK